MRMTIKDIPAVDKALKKEFKAHAAPIIELIEAQTHDPFCVLVGTILSARTKDACTAGAVRRLFAAGVNGVAVANSRRTAPAVQRSFVRAERIVPTSTQNGSCVCASMSSMIGAACRLNSFLSALSTAGMSLMVMGKYSIIDFGLCSEHFEDCRPYCAVVRRVVECSALRRVT